MNATFTEKLKTFIARVPQRHILQFGKLLGTVIYSLDLYHRRIVRRNLQLIHEDWSIRQIQEFSKDFFQCAGTTILEYFQMTCFTREDVLQRVRIKGDEHLQEAMKNPKGLIFISAHLGNWEMLGFFLSCYLEKPIIVVGRKIKGSILNKWSRNFRERFGNILIDRKGAFSKMSQALRQADMVGLLMDQRTKGSEEIDVKFLGQYTKVAPAAALLSLRCESTVLPIFCVREKGGNLVVVVSPPYTLERTKNLRSDLQINTQKMIDIIEKAINKYPEQWFWSHKKWN